MRRTPIIALVLAPVVLAALGTAWFGFLRPLGSALWRSELSVRARVATGGVPTRVRALRDVASTPEPGAARIALLVDRAQHDPDEPVRTQALRSLGAVGARQALPAEALAVLETAVLAAGAGGPPAAAVDAIGQAAARSRIPEDVVLRIARVGEEGHGISSGAIEALARIGAAQALPEAAYAALRADFEAPRGPGRREELARAFRTIAKDGGRLPAPVLDALAEVVAPDDVGRVRDHAIEALAYSSAGYPRAKALLEAAARGPGDEAARGLRIIEARELFAGREPMAVALDRSLAVESRLVAMRPLKQNRREAEWRAGVLALARDPDPGIAAAALELFPHISGSPDDAFDRESLIPQLLAAMEHADPRVRRAAYAALGRQLGYGYRRRSGDFREALEAGARDPDPEVRLIALAATVRADPDARGAIVARGLDDPDPDVRRNLVGWLGSSGSPIEARSELFARALADPDPGVRQAAEAAQRKWSARRRSWPIEAWKLWRSGEYEKLGLAALAAVTVATPVLVGVGFFLYFMARLLTALYAQPRRALAAVGVMAVWAAAGYGMAWLYFLAAFVGHAGGSWNTLQVAGILWLAIALYAGLGWGLHYAVRR